MASESKVTMNFNGPVYGVAGNVEGEVLALKLKALQQAVTLGVEQAEQGQFCQRSIDTKNYSVGITA